MSAYWKCPNCGFRVPDATYQYIRFEPTCQCGTKWSLFSRVQEDEPLKCPWVVGWFLLSAILTVLLIALLLFTGCH